jgi:hypothetical protein
MTSIYVDAARFINLVAQMADQHIYPGVPITPVLNELNSQTHSTTHRIDCLPAAVQGLVQKAAISTFSDWLRLTSILEPPLPDAGQESVRKKVVEDTAKEILEKLEITHDPAIAASQQLLTLIFQQAYSPVYTVKHPLPPGGIMARNVQLEEMLKKAHDLAPRLDQTLTFKANRTQYRTAHAALNLIFNNMFGSLIFWFVTYKIFRWAQLRLWDTLSQTLFPKTVSVMNEYAPAVPRTVHAGINALNYLISQHWKPTIHFFAATLRAGKEYTLLDMIITPLEYMGIALNYSISKVSTGSFWVFVASGRISVISHHALLLVKEDKKAKYLREGGTLAWRVWIDLTTHGARAGILKPQLE